MVAADSYVQLHSMHKCFLQVPVYTIFEVLLQLVTIVNGRGIVALEYLLSQKSKVVRNRPILGIDRVGFENEL